MSDTSDFEKLRMLSGNLASLWNGGREILDELSSATGDSRLSPRSALNHLGPGGVEHGFGGARKPEIEHAFQNLTRYLTSPTWFDRAAASDDAVGRLREHPIAYFCMEYGLASWLPIYSGGLGILAADMVKEASDMGVPFVAIGLFYRHGFFHQRLDSDQYQTEIIPTLEPHELPLEPAVDQTGQRIVVSVLVEDRVVYARAWKVQVGRVPVYLLDTDVPENERQEDRDITASLYGGDIDARIQQEIILGIGGMRLLRALDIQPSICSLNEGHAAFLGLELLAETMQDGAPDEALKLTRRHLVYTNHTVVPAGNDVFARDLIRRYLTVYADSSGIGIDAVLNLGSRGSDDAFSMAVLAFQLSGKANAVSELHAQVIPHEWPGYSVVTVTNGVHVPTWLGPNIRQLLDEFVPDWRGDNPEWGAVRAIPNHRLTEARAEQRRLMIELVNARQSHSQLDPSVPTVVWARRFAEYKRAWMIASDLTRLARIVCSQDRPLQIVIAGKAHPRDEDGKRMLQGLLQRLSEDGAIASQVAFIPDYDERVARALTMGADVWLNTPRKPFEASGTSGMKSSDNGGLQLTVTDGWASEVDWCGVGWGIDGAGDDEDTKQLYSFLEDSIVPLFYSCDEAGVSSGWMAMVKSTMILSLSQYSARRMLLDYLHKLYLPLMREDRAPVPEH